MSHFIDLTGKQFGKWQVIRIADRRKDKDIRWLCRCSCEEETVKAVPGYALRSGKSKSCGCRRENLIGKRFGLLTVVERSEKKDGKFRYWRCVCDCGNEKISRTSYLKNGNTSSCGCLRAKNRVKENLTRYIGKRFSDLTVTAYENKTWVCTCVCGNKTTATISALKGGKKKSCGCLVQRKKQQLKQEKQVTPRPVYIVTENGTPHVHQTLSAITAHYGFKYKTIQKALNDNHELKRKTILAVDNQTGKSREFSSYTSAARFFNVKPYVLRRIIQQSGSLKGKDVTFKEKTFFYTIEKKETQRS
jgi:hypothetical protein